MESFSMLETFNKLRDTIERVEAEIGNQQVGTRRHAELSLAYHKLMEAIALILHGRLTPDDLVWGCDTVAQILADRDTSHDS